jgi:hypothetical protein
VKVLAEGGKILTQYLIIDIFLFKKYRQNLSIGLFYIFIIKYLKLNPIKFIIVSLSLSSYFYHLFLKPKSIYT